MEYVVVAFRSRAHTVGFYERIKNAGIRAEIVNTPKEAGVGCGLSVKVDRGSFALIKRAVGIARLNSFAGFFLVKEVAGRRIVTTI
ncbi:MAG: DUF3343 domain-containing protein [Clostridia bacterium]|nr:DUF3343 domain-containing protein [Clostridia bacterium]